MDKKFIITGSILSVLRVSSLWIGSSLLTNFSDSRQVIGYFLTLFSLPEAIIVRSLRKDLLAWRLSLSLFLVIGSFILVYIIYFLSKKVTTQVPSNSYKLMIMNKLRDNRIKAENLTTKFSSTRAGNRSAKISIYSKLFSSL